MLKCAIIHSQISIKSADTFVRPVYAGNALSTVQSSDAVKFISVRPTNFEKAKLGAAPTAEIAQAQLPEKPETGTMRKMNDFSAMYLQLVVHFDCDVCSGMDLIVCDCSNHSSISAHRAPVLICPQSQVCRCGRRTS
jgi:hypothetical protein